MSHNRLFIWNLNGGGMAIFSPAADDNDLARQTFQAENACFEESRLFLQNLALSGEALEEWRFAVHFAPRGIEFNPETGEPDPPSDKSWPVYDGPVIYTCRPVMQNDLPANRSTRARWRDTGTEIVVDSE